MEVAGLVLGALPVAMMAVDSYFDAVKLIGEYKDYEQTLKRIRRNIFIQEQQLQTTLEGIGLVKPTIQEVQERLREVRPDCYHQFIEILEHMGCITSSLLDKLDIDSSGKPKWINVGGDRVFWEWRRVKRSFGVKERKELFDELQHWNNALRNCLEPNREIISDYADPMTTELVQRFNIKSCDEARTNFRIIHEALAMAWADTCTAPRHLSNVELIWQHRGLEETGQLQLSVPEHGAHEESKHWQRVLISIHTSQVNSTPDTSVPSNPTSTVGTSTAPRGRVRGSVSRAFADVRFSMTRLTKISKLVKTTVVPESRLQLDCLQPNSTSPPNGHLITELCNSIRAKNWNGHLLHTGPMNEKIIHMKKAISPCSSFTTLPLESVISDYHYKSGKGKQVAYTRLSRKERPGIAAAAVWAVLVLCGTPWLDERPIGKGDITLLVDIPTRDNHFGHPRTHPTLLYTFKSKNDVSNKIPDNSSGSYLDDQIRHKTLFTLGVLLIELGLNKTFDQLRRDSQAESQAHDPSVLSDYQTANQIIESEELEREVCDSYAYAVQRCIQCHFLGRESTQNFSHAAFRKQFFTGVVAPVQATFDAQITSLNYI
ncbi:hypothetical protein NPX13_g1841 [Xylaria arbuscula]|uniref:DUF7580 domain-containing protein n=1 Tax=Xylaria arbuscula TaxID=114810 RepID=A0A9W8NLA2_9PEZI|nr:hypothetical protein NPX13_g1841 [Xylaria arbuscula]